MSEIEPALTPEEWATLTGWGEKPWMDSVSFGNVEVSLDFDGAVVIAGAGDESLVLRPEHRRAMAAICLRGLVTREDVEMLRALNPSGLPGKLFEGVHDPQQAAFDFLKRLADHIESLLPPEES